MCVNLVYLVRLGWNDELVAVVRGQRGWTVDSACHAFDCKKQRTHTNSDTHVRWVDYHPHMKQTMEELTGHEEVTDEQM